jgi:hypothetical protein
MEYLRKEIVSAPAEFHRPQENIRYTLDNLEFVVSEV